MSENRGELILYQTEDGLAKIDVVLKNETVWLTRSQMAQLFDRDISVIGRHIRNIFEEALQIRISRLSFIVWMSSSLWVTG